MADSVEMPRLIRNRAAAEEHGPYDPCITFIHACVQARYLSERVSSLMHTRGVCVCVCVGVFLFFIPLLATARRLLTNPYCS